MRLIIIVLMFVLFAIEGIASGETDQLTNNFIDRNNRVSSEKLLEKADALLNNAVNDSAFMYYALIYNRRLDGNNKEQLQTVVKALNRASIVYFNHCDYKSSLALLLRALDICESISYDSYIGRLNNNIGNIYYQLKNYERAKKYYMLAYRNSNDSYIQGMVFNNLGACAYDDNKYDSAIFLFRKAYRLKIKNNDSAYHAPLNNIGEIYHSMKMYDSALYYYKLVCRESNKSGVAIGGVLTISNIGKLYFEMNKLDSAVRYLTMSNVIASKYKVFNVLAYNYLKLSEIEEKKGNISTSLMYHKKYMHIKDSIMNVSEYGKVSELQSLYDIEKFDKRIQQLNIEQEANEKTIMFQRRSQIVMGLALLIVAVVLIALYRKNINLNSAYNILVNKNMEIISNEKMNYESKLEYERLLEEKDLVIKRMEEERTNTSEITNQSCDGDKSQTITLSDGYRRELEMAILKIMNDREIFCDVDFSLPKLSELVNTNFTYVSWIINNSFNKNFRTFINEYRIKEACRMFSDSDYQKYSIETIATMVGFRSKATFNTTFKEITGVTPSVYIHSVK